MAEAPEPLPPPWPGPLGSALPFVLTAAAYVVGLIGARVALDRGVGDPVTVFVGLPLAWGLAIYVKRSRGRLLAAAVAVCMAGIYLGSRAP